MTLIEVMLVVAIGAILVTGGAMGLGALTRSNLRASSMTIAAAARFGYHHAVSQGVTVRIALDFDNNTLALEEAHGQILLSNPNAREYDEDAARNDDGARDPWLTAQGRLDDSMSANLGRSSFSVISETQVEDGEIRREAIDRFYPRAFEGAMLYELITPHEREPRRSGKGYIYFFPNGYAEHSVVQLTDGDDLIYSVEIEALTGRATVHPFPFGEDDMEPVELRDPG